MATSGFTNFAANVILNKMLNGTAGTWPGTMYCGLFTVDPTDSTGGTELLAANLVGYARQSVVMTTSGMTTSTVGSSSNVAIITFGTAGAGSVSVTSWGLWDALTSGNLWLWANLSTDPTAISVGNPYSIPIGGLVVALI
jgi:hypothetical protein